MNRTLGFYNSHAAEVTAAYEQVDFSRRVDRFAALLNPGARVLDLGCGSGRDAARLAGKGFDVVAADGSEVMLARATELHPELTGRTAHVELPETLPFDTAAFDGATSWAVIMHLAAAALPDVFRELARVIAPGGLLAYSVNTARSELDARGNDPRGRHFTCLASDAWELLHENAGFQTIDSEETDDIVGRPGIRWVTFFARRI